MFKEIMIVLGNNIEPQHLIERWKALNLQQSEGWASSVRFCEELVKAAGFSCSEYSEGASIVTTPLSAINNYISQNNKHCTV